MSNLNDHPAPTPGDLKTALEDFTEGPNIEASPWELQAARGETPLEGPRANDALDWDEFLWRYGEWKAVTLRFEAAVRDMRAGAPNGRERAQHLARALARLHHAFMESSKPYFQGARVDGEGATSM